MVDRDEIETKSDWGDAVMASPAVSATAEKNSTGEECTSVENSSAVQNTAPAAETAAVEHQSHVDDTTTVAGVVAVPVSPSDGTGSLPVQDSATVALPSTDASFSAAEGLASTQGHRVARSRPIVRVTDGLTPGQYAVYSLMYEAGEGTTGSSRIYKGGYADLGRLTGLSKRGIQNIIAELQAKHVISIHQQPGYHRNETSAYLVPEPTAVLQAWFSRGWRRAVGKSKTLIS